jgi:hypothetical protein
MIDTTKFPLPIFPGRKIGKCSPQNLAASYLDFNTFDYFIWGWAKEMFYRAMPETSETLLLVTFGMQQTASGSQRAYSVQSAVYRTKWRGELWLETGYFKLCFKHVPV